MRELPATVYIGGASNLRVLCSTVTFSSAAKIAISIAGSCLTPLNFHEIDAKCALVIYQSNGIVIPCGRLGIIQELTFLREVGSYVVFD